MLDLEFKTEIAQGCLAMKVTQHGDVASFHTAIEVRYVYTNNVHIVYVPQLGMKQDEAYMVTLW